MVYFLPTFDIWLKFMVNVPYIDPMGNDIITTRPLYQSLSVAIFSLKVDSMFSLYYLYHVAIVVLLCHYLTFNP